MEKRLKVPETFVFVHAAASNEPSDGFINPKCLCRFALSPAGGVSCAGRDSVMCLDAHTHIAALKQ